MTTTLPPRLTPVCLYCDADVPAVPGECPNCHRHIAPHGPHRTIGEMADVLRLTGGVIVLTATPDGYVFAHCRPAAPIAIVPFPPTEANFAVDPIDVLAEVVQSWQPAEQP